MVLKCIWDLFVLNVNRFFLAKVLKFLRTVVHFISTHIKISQCFIKAKSGGLPPSQKCSFYGGKKNQRIFTHFLMYLNVTFRISNEIKKLLACFLLEKEKILETKYSEKFTLRKFLFIRIYFTAVHCVNENGLINMPLFITFGFGITWKISSKI